MVIYWLRLVGKCLLATLVTAMAYPFFGFLGMFAIAVANGPPPSNDWLEYVFLHILPLGIAGSLVLSLIVLPLPLLLLSGLSRWAGKSSRFLDAAISSSIIAIAFIYIAAGYPGGLDAPLGPSLILQLIASGGAVGLPGTSPPDMPGLDRSWFDFLMLFIPNVLAGAAGGFVIGEVRPSVTQP